MDARVNHSHVGRARPAMVFRMPARKSGGQCPPYAWACVAAVPPVVATRSV
jgi:hypothetical protein